MANLETADALSTAGVDVVARRLYEGWGRRAHGPHWEQLTPGERASWRQAARVLLEAYREAAAR